MARMAAAAAWGLGKAALPGTQSWGGQWGWGLTSEQQGTVASGRVSGLQKREAIHVHFCLLRLSFYLMALPDLLDMHKNLSSQGSQGKQCASISTLLSGVCILAPLSLAFFCISALPGASVSWLLDSMIARVLPACFYPTGVMKEVSCLSPWFLNFIVELSQWW